MPNTPHSSCGLSSHSSSNVYNDLSVTLLRLASSAAIPFHYDKFVNPLSKRTLASERSTTIEGPSSIRSPPAVPKIVQGTSAERHSNWNAAISAGGPATSTRAEASPNQLTSTRSASRSNSEQLTTIPTPEAIAISASATAIPPSEQSCAARTRPAPIPSRSAC